MVDVSFTNCCSVSRFFLTPWVYMVGMNVSTPGIPKGIWLNLPFHMAFCLVSKVQVSVPIVSTAPQPRPHQRSALSSLVRIGGQVA